MNTQGGGGFKPSILAWLLPSIGFVATFFSDPARMAGLVLYYLFVICTALGYVLAFYYIATNMRSHRTHALLGLLVNALATFVLITMTIYIFAYGSFWWPL